VVVYGVLSEPSSKKVCMSGSPPEIQLCPGTDAFDVAVNPRPACAARNA
jgi:hypothetical protein